jgi:tetratricopeptide (TPR) repeat protein
MWLSSRANSAAVFLALVIACRVAAPAAAADTQGAWPDQGERYRACLALAHAKPGDGLASAEDWRMGGGGFPAEHCAAVALIALKRYREAARRLESLAGAMMSSLPELRAGALEQAGQAWLLAGDAKQAGSAFDAALTFRPDDPELLIDRAQADAESKAWGPAIAALDKALAVAPKRADALIFRASAERQTGQLDRALADVEQALKLAPETAAGLLERGNIRSLKDDAAGARADWNRVEALDPRSPAGQAAHDNLARLATSERKP